MATISTECQQCNNEIKRSHKSIKCVSCEIIYHIKCAEIQEEELKMIQGNRCIQYMCKNCNRSDIIINAVRNVEKRLEECMEIIKNQGKMIENNSKLLVDATATTDTKISASTNSYAVVTSKSNAEVILVKPINQTPMPLKYRNNTPAIIIKPKNAQTSEQTLMHLKQSVNPGETKTKITKIKTLKNGGVLIKGENKQTINELKNLINNKISDKYEVELSKLSRPRIKIIGLSREYTSEELMEDLKLQNQFITEEDEIEIKHTVQMRNKKWIVFAEVKGSTFSNLIQRRSVNVGWESCKIEEDPNVRRCTKCWGFGHKTTECNRQVTCKHCAGNHLYIECRTQTPTCTNCYISNTKFNTNHQTNHEADHSSCSILQNKIYIQQERIDYYN